MIEKRNIPILILCIILVIGVSSVAVSTMSVYPRGIRFGFEYDDNVTREKLQEDYKHGIIWRLDTGFGVKDFIPIKGLNTEAEYDLRMRDVNTSNDEDYSSQRVFLSSRTKLKTGTRISLKDEFRLWNSQSDLFNFYDNLMAITVSQPLGERTTADLSYKNLQKRFQNDVPEVQARNSIYHWMDITADHRISSTFRALVGYAYGTIAYNRSPIDFRGDRSIALDGVQRDRQNVITFGFRGSFFNYKVSLNLLNQVIRSNSNSRAFNFNGNRATLMLQVGPFRKLSADFTYRIVAHDLGAYQTPEFGYELTEVRSDDQSGITLGVEYDISDQVSLRLGYERIENTVFFTKEFYEKNIFNTSLKVKF